MWYTIYMKLTKNDIEKWSKHWDYESNDAVQTAQELYQAKRYHHALFFCHLAVEKELKAYYVKKKETFPPPVHDLLHLMKKSEIAFTQELTEDLAELNSFNIRARYDDYKKEFYKKATKRYCEKWIKKVNDIISTLKNI